MATSKSKAAPMGAFEPASAPEGATSGGAGAGDVALAEVELALADLIGDRNGEIVLFNDSGVRSVALRTACAVVARGRAGAHRTAAGDDVSGFRFLTFANGQTLYFEPGLEVVTHPRA